MGEWGAAASILEEMAAESKDPYWLCLAAENYYRAGKFREAKRVYSDVKERPGVPDDIRAMAMYGLALCYWDTGLKNAGRRLMLKVTEQYPDTQGAIRARGLLYRWSEGH